MSQLQPTLAESEVVPLSVAAPRPHGRFRLPGWLRLLLDNPKSRFGLVLIGFIVTVAVIAPWISVNDPTGFNLLATRQAPSWHHLFGTTDQGSDIFSQVVLGARRSLVLGAAAAVLATALAAILGMMRSPIARMVKIFDRTIQRQITYDVRSPCKTKMGTVVGLCNRSGKPAVAAAKRIPGCREPDLAITPFCPV